jgi:hypothetical protein
LDLLDVTFLHSPGFDSRDIPAAWGVEGATGLVPNGGALMLAGLSLGLIATYVEVQRKGKAEQMAQSYTSASAVHWD